jgi:hypothetical protein
MKDKPTEFAVGLCVGLCGAAALFIVAGGIAWALWCVVA